MSRDSGPNRFWLGTCFFSSVLTPECWDHTGWFERNSAAVQNIVGQGETCPTTGNRHWQLCISFKKPIRRAGLRKLLPGHWEPTSSVKAREYCQKEETRIEGTCFQHGEFAMRRNNVVDWESVVQNAKNGKLESIPADVYVRCYNQLKRISKDHLVCPALVRTCYVFWGPTRTGKSRRAWQEAGMDSYSKDPNTKWWDGYRGQEHVVIDEFRGLVSISNLLRWTDRYPVAVETKGGSDPFVGTHLWITSNLDPRKWYPELDEATLAALLTRLTITHFNDAYLGMVQRARDVFAQINQMT